MESEANELTNRSSTSTDALVPSVRAPHSINAAIKTLVACTFLLVGGLVFFAYTFSGTLGSNKVVHDQTYQRKPAVPQFWRHLESANLSLEIPRRTKREEPGYLPEELDFGLLDEPNSTEYANVLSALREHLGSVYAVDVPGVISNFSYSQLSSRPWSEQLRANFLWAINYHVPAKEKRTAYFEQIQRGEPNVVPLPRFARAIVFYPPEIREYLIGPMNAPTEFQLVRTLPYEKRPLGTIEYEALVDFLTIQCMQLDSLLQEAYGASFFRDVPSQQWSYGQNAGSAQWTSNGGTSRCQSKFDKPNEGGRPHCLMPTFTSPMITHEAPGRRRTWFRLMHQVITFIQHPVDIQFNVDHTSMDPAEWYLVQIWFQGHFYNSVSHLMNAWKANQFRVRYRPFTYLYSGDVLGKTGRLFDKIIPVSSNAGPKLSSFMDSSWVRNLLRRTKRDTTADPLRPVEKPELSKTNRLSIRNRQVKYDLWNFHFTVRRDTGLRIYGAYFDGVSILAEGGMDETATVYWGWTPFMRYMTSLESMYGIGAMIAELSPGIDCPQSAIYFPVQLVLSGDVGPVEVKHGVCLFESTVDPPGSPVRRHYEFPMSPTVEHGLPTVTENDHTNFGFAAPGRALTVRFITSLFNYDYLFDAVFHTTGVLEFAVTPTGHIHVDAIYPWPESNRFQSTGLAESSESFGFLSNTDLLSFVIHHHLFHFKVDLDVIGRRNAFDVVHVYGPLSLNDSRANLQSPGQNEPNLPPGLWMKRTRVKTELDARFHTKFEVPVQYLTCAKPNQFNPSGPPNLSCVGLVNKGAIKTLLSNAHTEAFAWTRHQISVTRYHEDESCASSIYNGVDLIDPVVNFTRFSENNESIEDADIVLWVTVGNYHLPRHEDLPNTATTGGKLAFYLTPHNLFRYSPDAFQCDRLYTENKNEWIRGIQPDKSCVSRSVPKL